VYAIDIVTVAPLRSPYLHIYFLHWRAAKHNLFDTVATHRERKLKSQIIWIPTWIVHGIKISLHQNIIPSSTII
jgi:hypothetical protein